MGKTLPTIAIIGCGYVGLTTAAILANCGYKVFALEINKARLRTIKSGRSFFYEEGMDQLIQSAIKKKMLIATDSYALAIPGADIVFSCVGTPDNDDGSSNLSFVFDAAEKASAVMKPDAIYVQKSTVPVGTGEKIETNFAALGRRDVRYVSNPEFLREGTAIADTLWFDRIVVGSSDKVAAATVLDAYMQVERRRNEIAELADIKPPVSKPNARYIITQRNSAELIKVTANAFLALKISFANSIAKLADKTGADVIEVMDGVGADKRIGRAFLNAGRGYGGGCFPKDVSGLIRSAEDFGVNMEIMQASTDVNSSMPHYILHKARVALGHSFEGCRVAVLGLAFKPGTSDTRKSPAIVIANTLAEQSAHVSAYDPQAKKDARQELDPSVTIENSARAAIKGAKLVFVATDWPEFKDIDYPPRVILVDCMNCIDSSKLKSAVRYFGIGR